MNSTYNDPGYTAIDIHDGDITSNVIVTGTVNTATVGTYTIKYNVSDAVPLPAVEVTRTVNVNDSSAPIPVDAAYDVVWNQTLAITLVANDNVDTPTSIDVYYNNSAN